MLTPKILIDDQSVMATGTVVSYGVQSITLYPFSPNTNYRVDICFSNNELLPSNSTLEIIGPAQIRVTFNKFDNPSGVGTSSPLHIANHLGKKILLSAANTVIGSGPTLARIFHYTFIDGGA
jgi:hypothetical protein